MKKGKALAYAIFSAAVPLSVYSALYFMEWFSNGPAGARVYVPLLTGHAVGLILVVTALRRTGPDPVNTASGYFTFILITTSILANVIAFEIILYLYIFRPHSGL